MQKGRRKWIWSICYGQQLIVFKSPDKYIQQKWSLLISKSVSCGRAVWLLSAILLWMSEWNFLNGKYKCSHVHCSILGNRWFSELKKKKLDGKFSKPLVKNFKIWLLLLKEAFFDAPNTSDMHNNNLNFLSSERGWFFCNGKMDSFLKVKIFPFLK